MNQKIDSGECFTATLAYKNENGKSVAILDKNGSSRPIVVLKDPDEEIYYAHNVTTKIDNFFNKRNGYLIQDYQAAGFKKESMIKCDSNNTFVVDPKDLKKPFGKLTEDDLNGFLNRLDIVRQREIENEKGLDR